MKNNKFWDMCDNGSIRQKIAEFIDQTPVLSKLKNKAYYDFEDAMVDFIYQNREMISREVDLEYQREDFIKQAKIEYGDSVEEVIKEIPIETIDHMISEWQDSLGENDDYWATVWGELSNVLTDGGISPLIGIDYYTSEEVLIYAAYLHEWFCDMPPEMQDQEPELIDYFFSNEMSDDTLSEYHTRAARKLFGDKIKEHKEL